MGVLTLNDIVPVLAVMFDKDTVVTMQDLSIGGFPATASPFPCKANTPYSFNCESVLLAEADVTVAFMLAPKAPHGMPLPFFTFDLTYLVE